MAQPPDPRLQIEIPTARSDAAPDADARADDGRWANRGVTPRADQGIGWVVVADEAIARILTTTEAPGTLDPVEALTDPAAHTKEGDLHVNDAGRRGGRVSREGGHGGPRSGAGRASPHRPALRTGTSKRVLSRGASPSTLRPRCSRSATRRCASSRRRASSVTCARNLTRRCVRWSPTSSRRT